MTTAASSSQTIHELQEYAWILDIVHSLRYDRPRSIPPHEPDPFLTDVRKKYKSKKLFGAGNAVGDEVVKKLAKELEI